MQQQQLFASFLALVKKASPVLAALLLSNVLYLCAIIAFQPPKAQAHTYVIGSDPVDGSTINSVPTVVHIFFNAPISPISTAHLYSIQNAQLVDVSAAPGIIPTANPRQLDIPVKTPSAQPQGGYEVIWSAVSNDDGHTSYGIIGFNIGFSSTGFSGQSILGPSTSNNLSAIRTLDFSSIVMTIWEWLVLVGLTFWIGILVMEHLLLPGIPRIDALLDRTKKQSLSLQWLCLGTVLTGEIFIVVMRTVRVAQDVNHSGFNFTDMYHLVIESNYGLFWLLRVSCVLIAMALLYWVNRRTETAPVPEPQAQRISGTRPLHQSTTQDNRKTVPLNQTKELAELSPIASPRPNYTLLWLLLAGFILFTLAVSGEAAQVLQPHFSAIVFDWLYIAALSLWFGSVAYVRYTLLPHLTTTDPDSHSEPLALLLRRLKAILLVSMGIALVCSLFLTEASISSPQQFLTDPYGRALLVQLLITTVMFLFMLHFLFVLRPKLTRQVLLLPLVDADLPARRTRQFALNHTKQNVKHMTSILAWLGAGVLFCSALMAFYAPPIVFPATNFNSSQTTPAANTSNVETKQIGNLSATVQVLPGRSNQANTMIVLLNDSNGKPITDAQVQVTVNMQAMNMGTGRATIKGGNPVYTTTFDRRTAFNMAGLWLVEVEIQRPGQPPLKDTFHIMLAQ